MKKTKLKGLHQERSYILEEPVDRFCLKCNKSFKSYSKGNRKCVSCLQQEASYGPMASVTPISTVRSGQELKKAEDGQQKLRDPF